MTLIWQVLVVRWFECILYHDEIYVDEATAVHCNYALTLDLCGFINSIHNFTPYLNSIKMKAAEKEMGKAPSMEY